MAQVKKLEGGGTPSKKYFYFNGQKVDVTDDTINYLTEQAKTNRLADRMLATIQDDLYQNNMRISNQNNGFDFENVNMNYRSARTGKQFKTGDNFFTKNFRTTEGKQFIKDAQQLSFPTSAAVKANDDTDLIEISTGNRRFTYDDQGQFDNYLQSNANHLRTLDYITDYFTLGREAGDKKYKFSGDGVDVDAMWSIYNNPNSPIDLADFRKRILAGDIDDSDPVYRFLDPFFQGKGSAVTEDGQQVIADQKQVDAWKEWSDRGFGNAADAKNFTYDSNSGKWVLNPNILASLGLTANSGAWFNDNFIRNHYGYDFLKDKVMLNGNWYTTADLTNPNSEAYKYLNSAQNDYYNKNRRGEFDAADAVMMTNWGDKYESVYNPDLIGDLYNDNNIRILATNLATDKTRYDNILLDPSYQVIKYINLNDQDINGLGQRPVHYDIYDQYGNKVNIYDPTNSQNGPFLPYDVNKFSNLYDFTTNKDDQKLSAYDRVSLDQNSPYYNAYALPPIVDAAGNEIIKAWKIPGVGQHVTISPMYGGTEGFAFKNMPDNIYQMLTDRNFLNSILSDRKLADAFVALVNGTGSDGNFDWIKGKDSRSKELIEKLTAYFGSDGANKFVNYFLLSDRNNNYAIAQPQRYKNGGIVKKQPGGRFEHIGIEKKIPDKVNKLAQKANGPIASKEIESWDDVWNNLSSNDKLELGAIITDLASSIVGYTGVGDIAAIGGGLVSNITRGVVDFRRDGFGTAAKNFLGRTALDAAALVPIVGDTANVGAAMKGLTTFLKNNDKVVRGLSAGFMAAGLTPAWQSLNKITSGEQLTMDDIQAFATGLSSLTGLGLRGARRIQDSRLASKIQNVEKLTYKAKVGDKDITLSQSDVDDLVRTTGEQNISAKLKALVKKNNSDLSDDEIAKLTPESFGLTQNRRKWLKDNIEKPKIEKEKGAFRYFLPGSGLRDDLKANVNNIKPEHLGSAANRVMRQYGISEGLGDGYEMKGKRWLNIYPRTKTAKRNVDSSVQDSQSTVVTNDINRDYVVPIYTSVDAPITDANLPIPIGKINTRPSEIIFKRQSPSIFTSEPRTVNDIRPLQQRPAKWRRLNAPQQQNNVEIVVGPDGVAKIGNRSQRFLNESRDLMQYYSKYRQYQQALNNVHSEKSLNRLMENMKKDETLQLMLMDQPGLLRNEFSAARQRAGLSKQDVGNFGLSFKQGGILKAQGGVYNLNRIESDWKKKQPTLHSEILTTPIKSILTNDELNTKREQYLNTNRYDSGDGSLGKEIDWNKFGIESINVANFIRPFGEASKLRGLNKKDSQLLFQTQGSTPPKPNFRYQNSVSNQYDSDLANLYLRARYQNQQTSDPKVQAANNAHANQLAIEHLNNKHQQTMSAWNDFLNKQEVNHNQWMQSAWQNHLRNLQIQNAANNIVTNGERNIQSQMSSILDKFAYKLQSDMYKNGQVELDRQNKLYQLDLMLSKAKTDEERAQLNKIITQLKSEDYINNMKQNAFYRKKGGKLRSTSDQMLIDNQKQVAKAIEKLNDNTMKLILKALS